MNNTIARQAVLKRAVTTFGEEAQLKVAIEEMSELTKAICKYWRTKPDTPAAKKAIASIREETADVQIMLDQIKILFGEPDPEEKEKLKRLWDRLDEFDRKGARE
jgi:NTP pyrophosphatase (non-canonical NTP hydrolase)